ncbi:MAG: hypothetical protein H0V73_11940 [Chloroflexi bacterium]|nr:hypothetical protein [Chloroflexota bacterium]
MKPPRPILVIGVLFVIAVVNLSRPVTRSGAEQLGYLIGTIGFAAVLSAIYVWWYRRRQRPDA